ncbi:MAG: HD domain-containing protein [Promethearchaeati archaeon SRVP18_Atabeyarchaeia-1]
MARKTGNETVSLTDCLKQKALEWMKHHGFAGHDETHMVRVHGLCARIGRKEKADLLVVEAAALLHDVGRSYERENPGIDHAEVSAKIAEKLLGECRYPEEKASQILYAIRVHRFSQHRTPGTLEAKILQDADRIDISGAIGVAMAFAYGGAKNMELYDTADPLAKNRELDDDRYVLDHFQKKLLKLGETIHTETGRQLVKRRQKYLASFVTQFIREIG